MATDTARVQLELASGRNENTAPFHQTAQRRRQQLQEDAASVDAPVELPAPTEFVDVALAMQVGTPAVQAKIVPRRSVDISRRPPWIAFIAALVAVGVAVWWVMSQRMPLIDPGEVIARNLNNAELAMADGRYTDPPERSAFHYYSTVLALDPNNAAAISGIDAIADRHLTNARVLLAEQKIAEAGVALEKARRVRPDHDGLATLEAQWRAELRRMLAAATVVAPKPTTEIAVAKAATERKAKPGKNGSDPASRSRNAVAANSNAPANTASELETPPLRSAALNSPAMRRETVAPAPVSDLLAAAAALAAARPSAQLNTTAAVPASEQQRRTAEVSKVGSNDAIATPGAVEPRRPAETPSKAGANIADENSAAAPPTAAVAPSSAAAGSSSVEPKLVKMVQPVYPQEALMRGLEGWVDVSLEVSPSGDVIAPRIEESSRGRMFNRAALSAVEQWKYEPRPDGSTSERVRVRLQFRQSK